MKKIVLSELQVKKLMDNVVNEEVPATRSPEYTIDDGRYRMQCRFEFKYGYDNLITYKGGEIDDIEDAVAEVTFSIDTQFETYGITKMAVTDIRGPQSIKTAIKYYPEGTSSRDDDAWGKKIKEPIVIPLEWRYIDVDTFGYKMSYIGVKKEIEVELLPDGNGGLRTKKIVVEVKNLELEED